MRAAGEITPKKLGETQAKHRRRIAEWNRNKGTADPEHYKRHILPKLQSVSVPEIVSAIGMTYPYCHEIKHGRGIPHPRWWERLGKMA